MDQRGLLPTNADSEAYDVPREVASSSEHARGLFERYLRSGTRGAEPEVATRVRLMNWLALTGLLSPVALIALDSLLGIRDFVWSYVAAGTLIVGGRLLLHFVPNPALCGNVMVAGIWSAGALPALLTGHTWPSQMLALVLAPFFASRLLTRGYLAAWSFVTGISVVAFFVLGVADFSVPSALLPHEAGAFLSAMLILALFGATATLDIETRLRRSSEQDRFTRSVLDAAPVVFMLHDSAGRLVLVNRLFTKMVGVDSVDKVIAEQDRLFAEAPQFVREELRENLEVLDTGVRVTKELTTEVETGRLRTYQLTKSRITGPDGDPYVLTVSTDITDRKQMEEEREQADKRFRMAFDESKVGMAFLDEAGRVLQANQVMADTLGCRPEDLEGVPLRSFTHKDDREMVERDALLILKGEATVTKERLRVRRLDGTIRWVDVHTQAVEDSGPVRFWTQSTDVTQAAEARLALERAKDEAIAANKAKSDFLAAMSYEMRTPMTDVLGTADVLLQGDLDPRHRTEIETIKTATDKLLDIVGSVLDHARMEAGTFELRSRVFDLCELLGDVAGRAEVLAEMRGLAFDSRIDPCGFRNAEADPRAIRRIIGNVVSNAVRYTDSGRIELVAGCEAFDRTRALLRVTVTDTGRGIPPDMLDSVFDEFTKVDGMTGGTGLGLTIANELAGMMGGRIGVESDLGRGSSFWIELPVRIADIEGAAEPAPAVREASTHAESDGSPQPPMRVLVAEDNNVNQKVLSRMLTSLGHETEVVANGADAVEACTVGDFDIVLMDCAMPVMDGYEATRRIRALSTPMAEVPVIAVTAHAMKGAAQQCFEAGMDAYLAKPFGMRELAEKLEEWRTRHHQPTPARSSAT